MPIKLEIVTGERVVYSDDVDAVIAPGIDGELGVLPRHGALMTTLQPGELRVSKGGQETLMAVGGGFMEVLPHKVTILADTAERADEIDEARAEDARVSAQKLIAEGPKDGADLTLAQAAVRRAVIRLKVAQKKKRRGQS